jgi:hypothetical protein
MDHCTISARLNEIKAAPIILWAELTELVEEFGNDLPRDDLRMIIALIRDKLTAELAQAKTLITIRARHCDSVTARLQLLEQRLGKPTRDEGLDDTIADESELAEPLIDESELAELFTDELTEPKDFDSQSGDSLLTLQASPAVAVSRFSLYRDASSQANLDVPEDIVEQLRSYNRQYLTLGLDWKKKCEEAHQKIRQLMTERANEMQELYMMISEIPSGNK